MKNTSTYDAIFNRFTFELPYECVMNCSGPGQKDESVEYWAKKLKLEIDPKKLASELKEYGAWNGTELADHDENIRRIIWIGACNIREDLFYQARELGLTE